ncbi:MAG: tetR [Polyangiaceae bacterium]|jgi:AcrR family transcriptional regulator|nr:tetR [Polyangiaceae bacterium]
MKSNEPKARGRPRGFDRDAALDQAMRLFWEHGYEATSVAQLTAAIGVSAPSLYAAFGDKEALFLQAVDRYVARGGDQTEALMGDAKTAREAVARVLAEAAVRLTDPRFPRGCMVVLSAVSVSEEAARVQAELARCRGSWEERMKARIERGIAEEDVPNTANPAALASFYMAVLQGMSLQAKDGASRERLHEIGDAALLAWPAPPRRKKGRESGRRNTSTR